MKTSKHPLLPLLPLIPMLLAVPAMARTAASQYTSSSPVENDSKDFDRGASLVMEGEFEQALPLLDKAAQGGNVMAQYLTAKLIRRGFGTPKDLDRAIRLLRSACAGQTFPEALLELGQALEEANADSAEWTSVLKRASAAGNSGASLELGNAYFLGSQIQRDLAMAFAWYSLAADQNNQYAINNLRAVQQNITDDQRARGQQILEELRSASRQGTAGGSVQFQFDLNSAIQAAFDKGRKAYEGRNLDEARRRLEPLARSRNPGALFYVARMHETGRGYDQDYLEAARLYAVAIQQGEGTSLGNLARLFKQGLGVSKSPNAAATLYYGAAWRGDADAQNEYGLAAIQGAGVERDPIAAYVWWTLASEAGNEHAKNNLPILLQQDLPQEKRAAADAQLADVRKKRAQGFAPAAPNLDLGTPRLMTAGAKAITKKYSSSEEVVVDSDNKKENDKKDLETWRSPDGKLLAKKPAG
ncbi:MAG: sel1 repeat family protein, partial [Planctomycetes bacterium]|nr:sel1 repeat family protein [Planctomycetota bacterium]